MRTGRDISPLLEPPAGGRRPDYASIKALSRAAAGLLLVSGAMMAAQAYLGGVGVLVPAVVALAVVASLTWLRLAYRNLAALGVADTRDSPASAVAWFVIPVANWLMTYLVLRDLYTLSHHSDPHGLNQSRSLLIRLWWLCWAAPPVASILSLLFFERPGLGTASARAEVLVSFDLSSLAVASVLGAVIIIRVTSLQETSHRRHENDADAGL